MSTIENSTTYAILEELPPQVKVIELMRSLWIPQAISVAAELRIADFLKEGAKCCKDIAAKTETHEDSLYRLLRGLATVGVFHEVEYRVFENTRLSEVIREDAEGSVRDTVLSCGYPYHWTSFGHMEHSIRTGETAFDSAFGLGMFEFFKQNPKYGENFNQVMVNLSEILVPSIVQGYDFNQFASVVDVGGNYGTVLIEILKAFPHLHGILFDQPHVVEGAKPYVEAAGLSDRVEIVGGSFFEEVPSDADCYFLKYIVHDWNDDKAVDILKTVRAAMSPTSKVLLAEHVIPEKNIPSGATFLDMAMMVMYGGRERSKIEYERLFERAGLRLVQVIETPAVSLIEVVAI